MIQQPVFERYIYIHMSTRNKSFLDMHHYLRDIGIKNNAFMLVLIDPDLASIDPRDPNLNPIMKQRVLRECISNYWYFIREIVRIPDQGGQVNSGVQYKLHRGNMAMNFGFTLNWNMYVELPRQNFKSISVVIRLLWEFNFGTSNSEMMFINKKHEDSKTNLQRLKDLRNALPSYLQMKDTYYGGKKNKPKDTVEYLEHPYNKNRIRTLPAARTKTAANGLGRGCTQPRQWYDEHAFIPFIGVIYLAATPAFSTASRNAKANGAPYGIIITTTPGDLTTEEGRSSNHTRKCATVFSESMYDKSYEQLNELLAKNEDSIFVYMRFTYQQLGRDEAWFKEQVKALEKKWSDIRREILLEWSEISDNSPFSKEDLNIVESLIKQPIRQITLCNYFTFDVYEDIDLRYPPLIGVDVSGGYNKDSSAIVVIDSKTTKVSAVFNCNYISPIDLASVIYELVTKYMRNAVINVERNGGFGASVLAKLVKTSIKRNLYYEIKDRVLEERSNSNGTIVKRTQKTKVYGLDSTKNTRELLMEILRQRMDNHKDKFVSPYILEELKTLEVKKSGKIEHSLNGHDDTIFAYLLALYIWYEGKDLMERYGIEKSSIKTDQDLEEAVIGLEEKYDSIIEDIETELTLDENIKEQINYIKSDKSIQYEEFLLSQTEKDRKIEQDMLMSNVLFRKGYAKHFNIDEQEIVRNNTVYTIPDSVFRDFYE